MNTDTISILSVGSFSPLGDSAADVWQHYLSGSVLLHPLAVANNTVVGGSLPESLSAKAAALKQSNPNFRNVDKSVLYAVLAARNAAAQAGWAEGDTFGINIGSSRGATDLFEQHYNQYLTTGKAAVQASPSTTLGNIASWVAQNLKHNGPEISHSITCSTALHAILNGVAWLKSGLSDKFLVGGSEAPLTGFTIAQMQAMKIYSPLTGAYPCHALDMDKELNTMVLGEGAAVACLEAGRNPDALGYIAGIGYATETIKHGASLSDDAECLQKSMKMALSGINPGDVDAVVMHAPGTIKGDLGELNAIKAVFGESMPLLTTNKWKIGHTFGASGLLSLEMALLMMQHNTFIASPFYPQEQKRDIRNVLINAVGFGGNAVSILVGKQ